MSLKKLKKKYMKAVSYAKRFLEAKSHRRFVYAHY